MRIFLRSLVVLSLSLFLVACESLEERAEGHYQSALALIEAGDYERAEIEFRNVFELNGLHRDARATYAQMLEDTGDQTRAYSQYLRLVEQYPEDLEGLIALTRLAMERQDWEEIERQGKRLIEVDATVPEADVADIALQYRTAVDDKDAAARARVAARAAEALNEFPDFAILRFILIQHAMDEGNTDVALQELDALLALDGDEADLHIMRLRLLSTLGREDEIDEELKALVVKFPENEEMLPLLLQYYGANGRPDDAIAYLRTYLVDNAENMKAINTLIELVGRRDGGEAALKEIEGLLENGTNKVLLTTQKGRVLYEMGERTAAVDTIEELLATEEESEDTQTAKVVLARMLLGNGNEVGARRNVEEVLASDSLNVAAMKMQANWLVADDKPDEAVTLLRTAIDLSPDDWEAMLIMADAFSRSGNHELSRDFVSLAVETSKYAPGPSLRFANILLEEGRLLLGEETLVNALRREPDNIELLAALGRIQIAREDWPRVEQIENTLRRLDDDAATRIATGLEVARLSALSRVDEAMSSLEELGESDNSVQAVAALVRARIASGDTEGALEFAQQRADESPEDTRLKLVLASTQLAAGNLEQGRSIMESILASNDQIERAWTALLRIETSTGTAESRAALLERALAAMPNSIALQWAQASILTENGDAEGAIEIYERIYEDSSASLVIANNLATLLANARGDTESLDRAYAVARRLRGSEVPAFQDTYGWIAFRRGEIDDAERYLEDAAKGLPNEPSVQYHLGMVYLDQERKPEALRQFLAAVSASDATEQFPEIELARAEADKLEAEGVTPAE